MSNSHGHYVTTTEATLKAFDKLPREVREALSEGVADWVPQPVLTYYRRLLKSGKYWPSEAAAMCIERIAHWNRLEKDEHIYRMERMALTGMDYHAKVRRSKTKRANQ